MVSFKRFRKVNYSNESRVATMAQGRLGLRGRGFAVQDGGGNLNGFRTTPPAEPDTTAMAIPLEPHRVFGEKSGKTELVRVQGPARFHRKV